MKNLLTTLTKSMLISRRLTASPSFLSEVSQQKSLKDFGLLMKDITQTTEKETKEQRGRFLGILFGTLGASLLKNLTSKT